MSLSIAIAVDPALLQLGLKALIEEIDPNTKVVLISVDDDVLQAFSKSGSDIIIVNSRIYIGLETIGICGNVDLSDVEFIVIGQEDVDAAGLPDDVGFISSKWPIGLLRDQLKRHVNSRKESLGDNGSEEVTTRERDIIRDIALGLSSKEIADKNFISPHTVVTHRKNISRKLGIKSISGLTIYAIVNKLISLEDVKERE
jgi:DNA-binding CsgD family transcriptional regulator